MVSAGVAAREEARSARRADRALAVGVGKGDAFRDQAVNVGRTDTVVSQRTNGVPTLLVRADPHDVRSCSGHVLAPPRSFSQTPMRRHSRTPGTRG